jgi:hypothetical protein
VGSFSNGDSVRVSCAKDFTGTVAFGPFKATTPGPDRYMVQKDDGTAVSVLASDMVAHVAFTVGEEAEERAMGRKVTIVAGPFTGVAGIDRYVVKLKAAGHHSWVAASALCKVTRVPKPAPTRILETFPEVVRRLQENMAAASVGASFTRGFLYNGRTYSLDGEYEDRQGDVWKFNGRQSPNGVPLMNCDLYPSFRDFTLSDVVSSYGPLSRA